MAMAQVAENWRDESPVDDSSSWSSSEDSSTSGGEDEADGGRRADGRYRRKPKGVLDISWSEFSRWPEDVIDEAADSKGPIFTLKISHNVMKEIPRVNEWMDGYK